MSYIEGDTLLKDFQKSLDHQGLKGNKVGGEEIEDEDGGLESQIDEAELIMDLVNDANMKGRLAPVFGNN